MLDVLLWTGYNQRKRKIEDENWGLGNEVRAFLAASEELNATNLHSFQSSGKVVQATLVPRQMM